jgi:hypothetical protein
MACCVSAAAPGRTIAELCLVFSCLALELCSKITDQAVPLRSLLPGSLPVESSVPSIDVGRFRYNQQLPQSRRLSFAAS